MSIFYVTFQPGTGDEQLHPRFLPAIVDGYLRITADSPEQAAAITQSVVGLDYSMIYPAEDFPFGLFPRGELAAFDAIVHLPIEQEYDRDNQPARRIICSCSTTAPMAILWGEPGHGD